MEIRDTGDWSYSIGGVVEASGFLPDGFDTSSAYRSRGLWAGRQWEEGNRLQSIELEVLEATHKLQRLA